MQCVLTHWVTAWMESAMSLMPVFFQHSLRYRSSVSQTVSATCMPPSILLEDCKRRSASALLRAEDPTPTMESTKLW